MFVRKNPFFPNFLGSASYKWVYPSLWGFITRIVATIAVPQGIQRGSQQLPGLRRCALRRPGRGKAASHGGTRRTTQGTAGSASLGVGIPMDYNGL